MRHEGTIIKWKDDKGFGFIEPVDPGPEIFFHAADFRSRSNVRPAPRMRVSFELIHVGGKGPRAMAVQPAAEAAARREPTAPRAARPRDGSRPSSGAAVAVPLMLGYFALLVATVWRGGLPLWVLLGSFALNVVTFFLYVEDKYNASKRQWRTPESTLHTASVLGGWPAAWVAQQLLRHKSVKAEFRAAYWVGAIFHCAVVGAVVWHFRLLSPLRLF